MAAGKVSGSDSQTFFSFYSFRPFLSVQYPCSKVIPFTYPRDRGPPCCSRSPHTFLPKLLLLLMFSSYAVSPSHHPSSHLRPWTSITKTEVLPVVPVRHKPFSQSFFSYYCLRSTLSHLFTIPTPTFNSEPASPRPETLPAKCKHPLSMFLPSCDLNIFIRRVERHIQNSFF